MRSHGYFTDETTLDFGLPSGAILENNQLQKVYPYSKFLVKGKRVSSLVTNYSPTKRFSAN